MPSTTSTHRHPGRGLLALSILLLAPPSAALAAPARTRSADEDSVRAAEAARGRALPAADTTALSRPVADVDP